MSDDPQLARLSLCAHVGRVILVIGVLVLASLLLGLVGIDFKGLGDLLDLVPGGSVTVRLVIGLPTLLFGWVLFRLGGGKQAVEAQKRMLK
jgi:hypothetical protein